MRICRILTNNALVVLDEKGKEQIVCGKGIGYKKRPGDNVDDKLVETVYVKEGNQSFEQIRRTLEALPEEYLLLAQHIVEAANVSLNMKLNPVMAVSLADHLFYAIQRFLEGTPIANSLTWEIKRFYQKEYEVGLMALDMVESQFKVPMVKQMIPQWKKLLPLQKSLRIYVISYVCTSVLRWMQTPATIIGLSHI